MCARSLPASCQSLTRAQSSPRPTPADTLNFIARLNSCAGMRCRELYCQQKGINNGSSRCLQWQRRSDTGSVRPPIQISNVQMSAAAETPCGNQRPMHLLTLTKLQQQPRHCHQTAPAAVGQGVHQGIRQRRCQTCPCCGSAAGHRAQRSCPTGQQAGSRVPPEQ
jgi:hypothetical protein